MAWAGLRGKMRLWLRGSKLRRGGTELSRTGRDWRRGRGDGPFAALGQAFLQLTVVGRFLLGVQQARPGHGDLAQQLLAHLALRTRLECAHPQPLKIGRLLDHFRAGLEEDEP